MYSATMACVYTACAVCVTIFRSGRKVQPVLNFTELHALTQATCFYVLFALYSDHNSFFYTLCSVYGVYHNYG